MTVPTIGRIVHYMDNLGEIFPAIITHVYSDYIVDLHVLKTDSSVGRHAVYGSAMPAIDHWFWPAYTPEVR